MHIRRVQIEEGFLDGLDLPFTSALNVIIGARGTGKTSLIELIRFCLDVPSFTDELATRSREHALAVLGPGQIAITLSGPANKDVFVSRTAIQDAPSASADFERPLVLSQTEIETLGLVPSSRLRLIDDFCPNRRSWLTKSHNSQARYARLPQRSLRSEAR